MQATMELAELDELVTHLDTQISQVEVTDDAQTPSVLLCSAGCGGGPYSWYWYC
jgi:hypothetical protein